MVAPGDVNGVPSTAVFVPVIVSGQVQVYEHCACPLLVVAHDPFAWQRLPMQLTEAAVHTPDWQASTWVQALLSLQVVPFAFGVGCGQPVLGLQAPTS